MPTLGVLHEAIASQLSEARDAARYLKVACVENDLEAFIERAEATRPQVIVLDFERMNPDDAVAHIERLKAASGARVIIVVYAFARRRDLEPLYGQTHIRVLKSPVSLPMIRSSISTLIGEEIMGARTSGQATETVSFFPESSRTVRSQGDSALVMVNRANRELSLLAKAFDRIDNKVTSQICHQHVDRAQSALSDAARQLDRAPLSA